LSVTTVLAIWGAVLSTVAILWNVRRDVRDRGALRVHAYVGTFLDGVGAPDPQPKLVFNVTNVGRRAVVVSCIGGDYAGKDKHFAIVPRAPWPRTLQPGEYLLEWTDDLSILSESVTGLWASDSIGKHWRVRRRTLRDLIKQRTIGASPDNLALNPTGLRPAG
jgi:hypothetical protein